MLFSNAMSWQGLPSQTRAGSYGGSGLRGEPRLHRGPWAVCFEVGFCQTCRLALPLYFCALPSRGWGRGECSEYIPNCPTVHKVNILFTQFVFLTREKLSQLGPTSLMAKALWVLGTVILPERVLAL